MQITIVQSEIETAIRNYIRSLISVNDGCDIKMELAATRGPTGFTATINIEPSTNTVVQPVAMVQHTSDSKPVPADLPNQVTQAVMPVMPAMPAAMPTGPRLVGTTPAERTRLQQEWADQNTSETGTAIEEDDTQAATRELPSADTAEDPDGPAAVEIPQAQETGTGEQPASTGPKQSLFGKHRRAVNAPSAAS